MFTKVNPATENDPTVYQAIKQAPVDAATLVEELEAATGLVLQGEQQQGHLVTSELAYTGWAIVQLRVAPGVALAPAKVSAAEQAIEAHDRDAAVAAREAEAARLAAEEEEVRAELAARRAAALEAERVMVDA